MASAMTDSVIRKACDRCHGQKLSCRRTDTDTCERCSKLKTECIYSPSLRYKKQQQQQQQQQPHNQLQQHRQQPRLPSEMRRQDTERTPTSTQGPVPKLPGQQATRKGHRSPKRRRTETHPNLVTPEAESIVSQAAAAPGLTTLPAQPNVTPNVMVDLGDFDFSLCRQFGFSPPSAPPPPQQQQQVLRGEEHLCQPDVPDPVAVFDHCGPAAAHTWASFQGPATSSTYSSVDNPSVFGHPPARYSSSGCLKQSLEYFDASPPDQQVESLPNCVSDHQPRRRRTKQRLRKISLRDASGAPAKGRGGPSPHWMAQLADINASLLDLASAIPQSVSPPAKLVPGRPSDERFKTHGFPIDEMFKLTRRVADILEGVCALGSGTGSSKARLDGASDPGGSMFILSTYVRLLDMYHRVFSLVRSELRRSDADASFLSWKLPDVTVGSFAVESSSLLQMSLTVQLAEEFLTRLRNSTAALEHTSRIEDARAAEGQQGACMFSSIVDISYKAVRGREESLRRDLTELKAEIEALLDD